MTTMEIVGNQFVIPNGMTVCAKISNENRPSFENFLTYKSVNKIFNKRKDIIKWKKII